MLGAVTLPGIIKVDADRSNKFDVKSAPGVSGATITWQGYEPAKVTITIKMWLEEHLEGCAKLLKLIEPKASKGLPSAWKVFHPALQLRNIQEVLVESIKGPNPSDKPGVWEIELSAIEWRKEFKAPPQTTKPSGRLTGETVFDDQLKKAGYQTTAPTAPTPPSKSPPPKPLWPHN